MISRPYTKLNGLKTIPIQAAHSRIANIWEYPPRGECSVRNFSVLSETFAGGRLVCTSFIGSNTTYIFLLTQNAILKVTVQFETGGNGQNEIVLHMDRSEVKL